MGIMLALCSALLESLRDATNKHTLKNLDPYIVSWAFRFSSLLWTLPLLLIIEIPHVDALFFWTLGTSAILNSIATILAMKALQYGELSFTGPIIALTPVFLLISSPIMVGEYPHVFGYIGVIFGVLGAYMLAYQKDQEGYLSPFRHLLTHPSSRFMLIVTCIASITANLDKIGIRHSSSFFWLISINSIISIILFCVMYLYSDGSYGKTRKKWKSLLLSGGIGTFGLICHVQALSLMFVSYVISIKRMSAVFSVFIGYFFFHEHGIKQRIIGSTLMILGAFFIALSQ